jgi:hypothetical protein
MLGRLRMTVDQCRRAYLKLSERIFSPKRSAINVFSQATDFLLANGKFNYRDLEAVMKKVIVEDCGLGADTLLQEEEVRCKV